WHSCASVYFGVDSSVLRFPSPRRCRIRKRPCTRKCTAASVGLMPASGPPEGGGSGPDHMEQKTRCRIDWSTSAMALVTSMPRGQASVQLKVVRQRHTPSLSLRISRRMSPPSSRESKMKRCALTIAAGPKYCPSVQNTGHDEVQAAQRMHFVVSSKA